MSGLLCTGCKAENHYPVLLDGRCRLCGAPLGGDYGVFKWWIAMANVFAMLGRVASKKPMRHEPSGRAA